ncbi:MAG: ABC transporter permease [Sphingobacteriales bacterium]|jgi:ABC-2 type transport system permease protein|nr:ABC transporter permease [Sphingobacteriales bacterium]
MKTLLFLLQKEFKQIFRDKIIVMMTFVLPIVQLGILPIAMNFEVNEVNVVVIDNDHSPFSNKLINKLGSSGYIKLIAFEPGFTKAMNFIKKGEADIILEIPNFFERDLVKENFAKVNLTVDAINGTKSSLGSSYLTSIIFDFNKNIQIFQNNKPAMPVHINIESSVWFNPYANYRWFIVPGILAFLLTIFAGSISATNIVREKEVGTIEQINVSPIKKWQFLLGKLIPFWIIGMIILTIGLIVAVVFYNIQPVGSLVLLYLLSGVYLIALLGFGLLVSTVSNNQLQAMFISFFFIMIFALMSGLFTSVESMPEWARTISHSIPITYFMKALRMIILKGSSFADIKDVFLILFGFAIALNGLAVWNYRKTS